MCLYCQLILFLCIKNQIQNFLSQTKIVKTNLVKCTNNTMRCFIEAHIYIKDVFNKYLAFVKYTFQN